MEKITEVTYTRRSEAVEVTSFVGITITSLLSIALRFGRLIGIQEAHKTQDEKFLVTYRDPESATKFVNAFNMNIMKRSSRTRTEAPEDYQRPAAAALTGELHPEDGRLINLCTGSHSTSVLIARQQKYGELEYYNEVPPSAFACYFNPENAAKAAAAESGRPLGARLKYERPVPGAICGSCFRVVSAQPKSYTSHRSLCAGPPKKSTTPTPRPAAPAIPEQPTPNTTLQSARGQTPSQRSTAFELPDFSKVKIEEGHSNHRVLHIYTAGESIDYYLADLKHMAHWSTYSCTMSTLLCPT